MLLLAALVSIPGVEVPPDRDLLPIPMPFLRFFAEHPERPAIVDCLAALPKEPYYANERDEMGFICVFVHQAGGELKDFAYIRKGGKNKNKIMDVLQDGNTHALRLVMRGIHFGGVRSEIVDFVADPPQPPVPNFAPPLEVPKPPAPAPTIEPTPEPAKKLDPF